MRATELRTSLIFYQALLIIYEFLSNFWKMYCKSFRENTLFSTRLYLFFNRIECLNCLYMLDVFRSDNHPRLFFVFFRDMTRRWAQDMMLLQLSCVIFLVQDGLIFQMN